MPPDIAVHQIYFRDDQKPFLDPDFIPYDNSLNPFPEQMEYRVFLDAYERGETQGAERLVGYVSWKFRRKTGIEGRAFLDFIGRNPGYDVYFINPFPRTLAWKNVWLQGECHHPGLMAFMQSVLDKLGYGVDLKALAGDERTTSFCNYWVGTPRFWDRYIAYTKPLYDYLLKDSTPEERAFLWTRASPTINATYFPFIFERMFTTLLLTQADLKPIAYIYSPSELRAKRMPRFVRAYLRSLWFFENRGWPALARSARLLFHQAQRKTP